MEIKGNKYGTHRVIQPKGVLTQAALKIDSVQSVEISGTNVLGDCILCDGDGYILLDNLEVELYEC